MIKKKYNVTIEQPMIFSIEVYAEDVERAEELAIEKWNNSPIVSEGWEYGTDAQIQTEEDDTGLATDWHNF